MAAWDSAVGGDAWAKVRGIGSAGMLVGIPCFNNALTIGHVVSSAAEGLALHFPGVRGVIVASDGGSTDGTLQVVERTPVPDGVEKVALTYQGIPGKGSAFRAIFEIARALGVKGCVVVDSDLRSITPDWIRLLGNPVADGSYGYVAPFYVRHKYDGTITNSIAYPMTRALYGVAVRQPIGGDFGFSAGLLDHYLGQDVWESDVARFGIDIWMTTTAINQGFRVCQAHLGAKIHDAKDPAASLGPMFRQVVGTLFALMKRHERRWAVAAGSAPAPLVGEPVSVEPEPVPVTVSAMVERFRAAYRAERGFWAGFLAEENLRQLDAISETPEEGFLFPVDLWVKIVYDFAVAYHRADLDSSRVVEALTGLYYGRTAAFCRETATMTTAQVESGTIEEVARRFEELKPYLVRRWRESALLGRP
ncbi:MAG: glycosyltransferase [Sphingomonadaceae bacterium]